MGDDNNGKTLALITTFDANYEQMGRMGLYSLERCAAKHGFDAFKPTFAPEGRPAAWAKIPAILETFDRGYAFALWVDSDAIYVDSDANPLDLVREGKDLYLVRYQTPTKLSPNSGVMLVRNSDWSRSFLQKLWSLERYIDHKWWEQVALIHCLCAPEFEEEGIGCEPDAVAQSKVEWIDKRWNNIPYAFHVDSKTCCPVIRHYAGEGRQIREEEMRLDLAIMEKKAHWKPGILLTRLKRVLRTRHVAKVESRWEGWVHFGLEALGWRGPLPR